MEAKMALVEVFRYSARNKKSSTKLQELWELHKAQGIKGLFGFWGLVKMTLRGAGGGKVRRYIYSQ